MGTQRMAGIPGFGIDRVAAAVGSDPEVLRLENLDTDLLPPQEALRATREAVGQADANSWPSLDDAAIQLRDYGGSHRLRRVLNGRVA
jgi:hypothetical protein